MSFSSLFPFIVERRSVSRRRRRRVAAATAARDVGKKKPAVPILPSPSPLLSKQPIHAHSRAYAHAHASDRTCIRECSALSLRFIIGSRPDITTRTLLIERRNANEPTPLIPIHPHKNCIGWCAWQGEFQLMVGNTRFCVLEIVSFTHIRMMIYMTFLITAVNTSYVRGVSKKKHRIKVIIFRLDPLPRDRKFLFPTN